MNDLFEQLQSFSLKDLAEAYNIDLNDIEGLKALIDAIEHDIQQ